MNNEAEARVWLDVNFANLKMLSCIKTYMDNNDECKFFEAFKNVDYGIYKMWKER